MTSLERRALIDRLRRDCARIAKRFGLSGFSVAACSSEKDCKRCELGPLPGDRATCWGCCEDGHGKHCDEFAIKVRVFNRRTGAALSYPNLVDTLVHEMAHVATWGLDEADHGSEWQRAYRKMLGWCSAEDIYDPGPER